ncbi:MAG: isochorismatase family protein [Hyphomicrobiaceae bacterium]|nr:isochorismatase family protein [Hyphomicrobiaceae bacterium]
MSQHTPAGSMDRPALFAASAVAAVAAGAAPATAQTPAPPANPALARLTPENAVLVYVDYTTGLDNLMTTLPARQYRNNIAAFAKFAALFDMPAAVLGEENDYYGTFLPEIAEVVRAGGRTFPRTQVSGYVPDFVRWLEGTGRRNVILGGISIDNCTLHTALDLLRAGYNAFVVVDVSSTNSRLAEEAAMLRLTQAGAVMCGWLNVLTELGGDFAGRHGRGMMGIVQAHWPSSTTGVVDDTTPDGRGLQPPAWQPRAG